MAVHRIANGKFVEHWAHMDRAGFMDQMAASPEREPAVTHVTRR